MATTKVFALIFLIGFASSFRIDGEDCERDKSRTVREVIYQEMLSLYREVGAKVPYRCPFYKARDRFLTQEDHKERETNARWACNYCGKLFIGEIYLDMHLANRHSGSIYKDADSVCLADYCEIFRCDVLRGVAKPTFWDLALCLEEDMQDLAQDCKDLMTECVPDNLNWNASKTLHASLSNAVCSFLTCKKYYDAPVLEDQEPPRTSYVVLTVVLCAGIIIYYCVAINYFWMDTFSDVYDHDEYIGRGPDSLFDPNNVPRYSSLTKPKRKTFIQSDKRRDRDIFDMKKMEGLQNSVKKAKNIVKEHRQIVENIPSASAEPTVVSEGAGSTDVYNDNHHYTDHVFEEDESFSQHGLENRVFVD